MFFFFCWTIIRTRIKNKKLLKKEVSWNRDVSFFFSPPPLSLSRHDKTFSIIRYFYLYFIVHDYSVQKKLETFQTASFSRNLIVSPWKVQSGI